MSDVYFDESDFIANIGKLTGRVLKAGNQAVNDAAAEVLRLSQQVVPLGLSKSEGGHPEDGHPGVLQNSGSWEHTNDLEARVGYHTPYAHRLHEHPEYHFSHGRKGKYLENPIKDNLTKLRDYVGTKMSEAM